MGLAGSAGATVFLSPSPALDPSNTIHPASGGYTEQACPTPQLCPGVGGSISGIQLIEFGIEGADGIANIQLLQNTTLDGAGNFTFSYQVFDVTGGGHTLVSSGGPPQVPPNFQVFNLHVYDIEMNWTLHGVLPGLASANWGVNVTTGPNIHVPEPATLTLLGVGMLGLAFSRRRKPD